MPTREEMRSLAEDIVGSYADRMATIGELRETVKMDLKGLQDSRTAMGREVRVDLSRDDADRKHEVSTIRSDAGALLRGFSAELKALRSELAGGQEEWQKLTVTMQSRRGGVATAPKSSVAENSEETTLRHRVFDYLANHPDGSKMTELEQEFGLARIRMAKLLKGMMSENKVKKQGLVYSAK